MSDRELIVNHVHERMVKAFTKGDLIDAQNMHAFLESLEVMSDEEYEELVNSECAGSIS